MRALIFNGEKLEFKTDYPKPKPNDDEVLIKVYKAGICNTDIEIKKGYMGFTGVLGHEFMGVVEQSCNKVIIEKRVVSEINCSCGVCHYCISGLSNHCPTRSVIGIFNKDGAFADYICVPEKNIHFLPDSITEEQAVFVELLAACFNVSQRVHIKPEDDVVILGDGKLGTLMARVIRLLCCNLTLVGLSPQKLERSSRLGIKTTLVKDFKAKVSIVIECTGTPDGLTLAKNLIKPKGKIIQKSTFASSYNINISSYVVDEIELIGSRCGPFAPAIRAIQSGLVGVDDLIDSTYSFDDALNAFKRAEDKDAMKVIMTMV
ncbi:alcohol dehydrogenase catalytic domain-containing protein [bacterium]|nr:alcohol dehydrogenase catalytic domain-containing protein [bacterium]